MYRTGLSTSQRSSRNDVSDTGGMTIPRESGGFEVSPTPRGLREAGVRRTATDRGPAFPTARPGPPDRWHVACGSARMTRFPDWTLEWRRAAGLALTAWTRRD